MLPVGFLFGLGFDTATEISLFTVAASQASGGMTFGTIMIFPALFTAGMTLRRHHRQRAHGRRLWLGVPQSDPQDLVQSDHHRHFRRRRALIGGIEALGLIAGKLGLEGAFWDTVGDLNGGLANFGYLVVGIFVVELGDLLFDLSLAGARSAAGRARLGGAMTTSASDSTHGKSGAAPPPRSSMSASPAGRSASRTAGAPRGDPRRGDGAGGRRH